MCACVGGQGGWEHEWDTQERGDRTHANEGDKLLIRVFIRAVGRDRRAAPLVGGTAWRASHANGGSGSPDTP